MGDYNRVILMGKLTREVETRVLPGTQTKIACIGLAVNRKWRDGTSGEIREEVAFIDCDAFGKTAEHMVNYLSKGSPILVEGRLKMDQWKDKADGSQRSKLKVVVDNYQFVDKGPAAQGQPPAQTVAQAAPKPAATNAARQPISEDDIPF